MQQSQQVKVSKPQIIILMTSKQREYSYDVHMTFIRRSYDVLPVPVLVVTTYPILKIPTKSF